MEYSPNKNYLRIKKSTDEEVSDWYIPVRAQLVVTRQCNLSCTYCNEFDKTSRPIPTARTFERIDKLRQLGTRIIELTGGEPLLHPDIPGIVKYAKAKGFERVMVKTNGTLITKKIIKSFNECMLDDLQVSLDGVFPNKNTVKVRESLSGPLELLSRWAQFRVIVSATIGSSSPDEIREVLSFVRKKKFVPRVLLRHGPDGQLNLSMSECMSYEPLIREFPDLFNEANGYRKKLIRGEDVPFMCRAGCKYLYIDESGNVRWCSQQRDKFGKSLLHYTDFDLKQQYNTRKPCSTKCTLGCGRTSSYDYRAETRSLSTISNC